MQGERASGLDWRDAAAYAPLLDAARSLLAWEWLRRDPLYVAAARDAGPSRAGRAGATAFGLVDFEPADLGVPNARPLWCSIVHPFILMAERASQGGAANALDLDRLRDWARLLVSESAEHLLLSDGLRTIRLEGPPGTFSDGPVQLCYRIQGLAAAEPPLLTLRRLLGLCRSGRFSRLLHPREARGARWVKILRAHDALMAGADQREIARALLSRSVVEPRWRSREPSVRLQAQRLVRAARRFAAGDYRLLLD